MADPGFKQTEEIPEEQLAQIRKSSNKKSPIMTYGALILGLFMIIAAIAIGIGAAGFDRGEPTPGTFSGTISCNDWTKAGVLYQESITGAANKANIHPALLGAIFLAENGDTWPEKDINSDWPKSSAGAEGPFQIVNFTSKWNEVKSAGLTTKATGDVNNFDDSALAAATYLRNSIKTQGYSNTTTDQNEIECLGAAYNGGDQMCKDWKSRHYGDPQPATNNNYHTRVWGHFQELSNGCQSASSNKYSSLADVISIFGSTENQVKQYIVTTSFMGKSIQVNKVIVAPLKKAEEEINSAGINYHVNEAGGFAWRANVNNPSKLSAHSFGLAVDINPSTNPNGERPSNSGDRDPNACKHDIPDNFAKIMEYNGFFWGAKYRSICDAMHFQYGGNWN